MKNKKSFWLAVVTLVLCLGVMATGIYAAKTAMLKLGATLGFNMHNCMVEVDGTISNVAQKQQDGSYKKTTKTIDNAIMGGEKGNTITTTDLDLGNLEFYAGEDMVFELTFKNLGVKSIVGKVDIKYVNKKVQVVESRLYDSLPVQKLITPNGTTTLTFALSLQDESARVDGFAITIIAEFKELEHEQGELYIENGRLYVEYGFYPTEEEYTMIFDKYVGCNVEAGMYGDNLGKPIRWLAFTQDMSDALTNVSSIPTTGDLYFVSEFAFDTQVFNSISDAPVQGKNPNDYAYSEIHTYLNNGFVSKYKLEGLLNAVQPRDLPKDQLSTLVEGANYTAVNGKYYAMSGDEQAKLWMLSINEWFLVSILMGTEGVAIAYYPSQSVQLTAQSPTEYGACWWLRSTAGSFDRVVMIDDYGDYYTCFVNEEEFALRPAFQITIA